MGILPGLPPQFNSNNLDLGLANDSNKTRNTCALDSTHTEASRNSKHTNFESEKLNPIRLEHQWPLGSSNLKSHSKSDGPEYEAAVIRN